MTALAQMLVQGGAKVTGTDTTDNPSLERLRTMGIQIHSGHTPAPYVHESDYVFVGSGTARIHPDRLRARRHGLKEGSPRGWLSQWMDGREGMVIAGRRDASVASAMIGWVLTHAGLDPTVLVGTPAPQLGGWARLGSGKHFVFEAMEEDGDLGPCGPRIAVLLSTLVPADVADPLARIHALRRFASTVPANGLILCEGPDEILTSAVRALEPTVESFSLARGSSWWGTDLREERGRYRFRTFHHGQFALEVGLQVPGPRNVLSAIVAVATCVRLGVPTSSIREALEEFTGVSRDFESRGSYRGVTLVDDEGRDPEEIGQTLTVGRQVFGSRRLRVVLWADEADWSPEEICRYVKALSAADHVLLMDGNGTETCRGLLECLVSDLAVSGVHADRVESFEGAIRYLDQHLEPGDVLVTLGAGEVGTIADAFIRRLSRDRQG